MAPSPASQDAIRQAAEALIDAENLDDRRRHAIELRHLASAIRANLVLIAAIVGGALALALVATLFATPRYAASASVQINNQSQRVLGNEDDSVQQPGNASDTDRFLQTQVDVLNSRSLADRVMKRERLQGDLRFFQQMGAAPPEPGAPAALQRDLTLGLLRANMAGRLPRNSRIATITFESTDPGLSARLANAFAEELIQASLQQRHDSSTYARSFVSAQLREARDRLEESERNLNTYARTAGLIRARDPAPGTDDDKAGAASSVTRASLMQLNAAASQAHAERIGTAARLRALEENSPLAAREALQNPAVQALFTQRADLEAKLHDELIRHLDGHPVVRQLRAQLKVIDGQLNLAARNMRSAARTDHQAATATERQLKAQVDALKAATMAEQDRAVQYNLLAREADTNRALYDGLLQRYKELNAAAGISTSNITIIDRADPQTEPSSPDLVRNLALALLAGLALAGTAIFLRNQFDDTVRVPEDVEHKLRLPLLGVVPRALANGLESALADPGSPVSEAYNSLRSALLYSTSRGLPRSILITSSQPAEGKTTTSIAIAQGLARMGRRVLLVDADLRRPSLHRRLALDNERGLSTLLTRQDSLAHVIQQGGQPNLDVITSGPVPPSPTELIAATRMEELVGELAASHDVVIFDSPPILGLADAPLMAAMVDGVVFIIESERTRRGSLKASLRRLGAMRPVMLGAALTMFEPAKARHRQSAYSGDAYYAYAPEADRA